MHSLRPPDPQVNRCSDTLPGRSSPFAETLSTDVLLLLFRGANLEHAPPPARQQAADAADFALHIATGERVIASPYAKKLAREAGVDIADATASGLGGRIVAADVEQLIKSGRGRRQLLTLRRCPRMAL